MRNQNVVLVVGALIAFSFMLFGMAYVETKQKAAPHKKPMHMGYTNGVKPLSELMPAFEIRSNSPTSFQIAFKAYNKTEWELATNEFSTRGQAEAVIHGSQRQLEINYAVNKALLDALTDLTK